MAEATLSVTARNPNKRYCSQCDDHKGYTPRAEYKGRDVVTVCSRCRSVDMWRKCEYEGCGSSFLVHFRGSPQRYCSEACAGLAKKILWERPCTVCGTPFKPKRESAKYCSLACMGKGHRKLADRVCEHCGQTFRPVNSKARFCDKTCYRASLRKPEAPAEEPGTPIDDFLAEMEEPEAPAKAPESDPPGFDPYTADPVHVLLRSAREWHIERARETLQSGERWTVGADALSDLISLNLRYGLPGETVVATARRYGVEPAKVESSYTPPGPCEVCGDVMHARQGGERLYVHQKCEPELEAVLTRAVKIS